MNVFHFIVAFGHVETRLLNCTVRPFSADNDLPLFYSKSNSTVAKRV